ncbi:MAG: hypothetical protein PHU46_13190 [Rhodocyclaceae bacterium]|nr:hypothetical protein [Rhodocyclaceae bacterium]
MSHKKKRKHGPGKRVTPRVPPMVALFADRTVDLVQHEALSAFRDGRATPDHFDVFLDCRAVLLLAASHKKDEGVIAVCDVAGIALDNLRDRYETENSLLATELEIQALTILVEVSEDFWRRTSGLLYEAAINALTEARKKRNDSAAAAPEKA